MQPVYPDLDGYILDWKILRSAGHFRMDTILVLTFFQNSAEEMTPPIVSASKAHLQPVTQRQPFIDFGNDAALLRYG